MSESIYTCHDQCPCQTGGEPTKDFLPIESAAVAMMLELGIPASEIAELTMDARRRRGAMSCETRTRLYGQSEPCPSCGALKWWACRPANARETDLTKEA